MALSKQNARTVIINSIDKKAATEIRMTGGPEYPDPDKYSFNGGFGNSRQFMPYAVVKYKTQTDIYTMEPSVAKKHIPEIMQRCILFSSEARKNGGTLYVVVEASKHEEFQKLLNSKMINATLVTVE